MELKNDTYKNRKLIIDVIGGKKKPSEGKKKPSDVSKTSY